MVWEPFRQVRKENLCLNHFLASNKQAFDDEMVRISTTA